MHKRSSSRPVPFLVAALLLTAGCSAPSLEISPRVGFVEIGGDLAWANSGDALAANSLADLGLDDTETVFLPRADFEFGPFEWILDYGALDYSGEGTAQFAVAGINAGADVRSQADLTLYRSTFLWDLFPSDLFDLALGFGIGAAEIQATVTEKSTSTTESTDELAPLPYLAARIGTAVGPVGAEGLVGFFAIEIDEVEVSYLDADAHLYWQFVDTAGMGARLLVGARYIAFSAEFDDDTDQVDADLDFTGPYVGLSLVL